MLDPSSFPRLVKTQSVLIVFVISSPSQELFIGIRIVCSTELHDLVFHDPVYLSGEGISVSLTTKPL